jgi:hypothetical protein
MVPDGIPLANTSGAEASIPPMGPKIRRKSSGAFSAATAVAGGLALAAGGGILAVHFVTGVAMIVAGGALSAVQPLVARRKRLTSDKLHALATLVEMTHTFFDMDKESDLRVTLMSVKKTKKSADNLQQVARHTCDGKSHPSKTAMTIHQGVAGHCYRKTEGKVESLVVNLRAGEDFVTQMVELGFEKEEAKKLTARGAYLCTPIIDSMQGVIAVLCLDIAPGKNFRPEHAAKAERYIPFYTGFLTVPSDSGGENG